MKGGWNYTGDAYLQDADGAVVGHPVEERGQIVKAFVVLRAPHSGDEAMVKALQDFVKATVRSYKYPQAVEFHDGCRERRRQRFWVRG